MIPPPQPHSSDISWFCTWHPHLHKYLMIPLNASSCQNSDIRYHINMSIGVSWYHLIHPRLHGNLLIPPITSWSVWKFPHTTYHRPHLSYCIPISIGNLVIPLITSSTPLKSPNTTYYILISMEVFWFHISHPWICCSLLVLLVTSSNL